MGLMSVSSVVPSDISPQGPQAGCSHVQCLPQQAGCMLTACWGRLWFLVLQTPAPSQPIAMVYFYLPWKGLFFPPSMFLKNIYFYCVIKLCVSVCRHSQSPEELN